MHSTDERRWNPLKPGASNTCRCFVLQKSNSTNPCQQAHDAGRRHDSTLRRPTLSGHKQHIRIRTGLELLHLLVKWSVANERWSLSEQKKKKKAFLYLLVSQSVPWLYTSPGCMAAHQDPLSAADVIKLLTLSEWMKGQTEVLVYIDVALIDISDGGMASLNAK